MPDAHAAAAALPQQVSRRSTIASLATAASMTPRLLMVCAERGSASQRTFQETMSPVAKNNVAFARPSAVGPRCAHPAVPTTWRRAVAPVRRAGAVRPRRA
eukprot:8727871-Lingulodinium_polyedra.AAC.1